MARVPCIHPWITDFAAYNTWIEPLGLLAVAGVLRAAGHEVTLIDCLDLHHPDAPAPRSPRDAYGCERYAKANLHQPPARPSCSAPRSRVHLLLQHLDDKRSSMKPKESKIGIVGLGNMGSGIAANLVKAGYDLLGYDLKPKAVDRLCEAGGKPAQSAEEIVTICDVILTSVEGKASIALADTVYLPNARLGQVYIDLSTVPAPETRRIGQATLERGAAYLDAPVSGGKGGAAAGTLRVFVGGDRATADLCWPLFEAIGRADKIVYCGEIGTGQVVKVVQQLTHRFPDVARMEVMSFGLRAGLDLDLVMRGLDVEPDDPANPYARLYHAIRDGKTDNLSGLYSEWAYFLQEAQACGFRMPMLEAMFEFCKTGPLTGRDPLDRPQPSIWNELIKG